MISYAKKSIACLEKLPQRDDVKKKIIDARRVLGLYYTEMNYHIEAIRAVDPVIDWAVKHDLKRRLSRIYTIIRTSSC